MRIVGIDFGLARIGIAISDPMQMIATVLETSPAKEGPQGVLDRLKDYLSEVSSFVVGLPLELSGKVGKMAEGAKAFGEALEKLSGLPVKMWDERLTSAQAEKGLKSAGFNRKKRAQKSDAAAAVLILQSFLDSL